jgi:hypothetical protein
VCGSALGGSLDRFEGDATRMRPPPPAPVSRAGDRSLLGALFAPFYEATFMAIGWLVQEASDHAFDLADTRNAGDPILPEARLDVAYQNVASDIRALSYSLELGYGALGADFRQTHYREDQPKGTLNIYRFHALSRMCAMDNLEVDFALGAVVIQGDKSNAGLSFGLPVRYWYTEYAGVELQPFWGNIHGTLTSDCDLSALVRFENTSLRLGYRWMESPGQSLNGPCIGLSFRY